MLHSYRIRDDSNFTLTDSIVVSTAEDDTVPMATSTSIPLSEYLQKTYDPDCEYLDGEVKERNLGTRAHGFLQTIIANIFNENYRQWKVWESGRALHTPASASPTGVSCGAPTPPILSSLSPPLY